MEFWLTLKHAGLVTSNSKNDFGLILRLVIGIAVGIALGLVAHNLTDPGQPLSASANAIMQIVGSIKHICGQFIFYAVPLVIIGFIAPSITRLGQNASKMLVTAIAIAYISSVGAAFFAILLGYTIVPMLSVPVGLDELYALPKTLFVLDIPAIMPVITALVTAIVLGITTLWTRSATMEALLNEFESIMLMVVKKFIIPILPLFIAGTFAQLAFEGSLTVQLPVFIKVILIALCAHFIWLALLYMIGGAISRRSPWEVVRHYGPAYLTAVGTM